MTKDPKIVVVTNTNASSMRALVPDAPAAEIKDPIGRPPDTTGPHGRAWRADLAHGRAIMGFGAEDDATLAVWVIEAPWAHPVWHSYALYLIHLRDMPDKRPTIKYMALATHEMWLYALDPGGDRRKLVDTGISGSGTCQWLLPGQFSAQIVDITDDGALERIERAVQEICDGKLSPDTDFQGEWIKRFGDNMIKREYR